PLKHRALIAGSNVTAVSDSSGAGAVNRMRPMRWCSTGPDVFAFAMHGLSVGQLCTRSKLVHVPGSVLGGQPGNDGGSSGAGGQCGPASAPESGASATTLPEHPTRATNKN